MAFVVTLLIATVVVIVTVLAGVSVKVTMVNFDVDPSERSVRSTTVVLVTVLAVVLVSMVSVIMEEVFAIASVDEVVVVLVVTSDPPVLVEPVMLYLDESEFK